MRYRIEHQWACFREPSVRGDRYVVAIEGAYDDLWEGARRARRWSVCMLGDETQVLRRAVYCAGFCENGSLRPRGRRCTPEAYVRRIRRLLSAGSPQPAAGRWFPVIEIDREHPAGDFLARHGCKHSNGVRYGRPVASFELPETQKRLVFDLVDAFPQLMAWDLAKVAGLPTS